MQRVLRLFVLAAFAAGNAARADEKKVDPKLLGAGRGLYLEHCAPCHGTAGKGNGPVADALKTLPSDLTALVDKEGRFPAERVRTYIDGTQAATAHGTREMPIWGKVFSKAGITHDEGAAAAKLFTLVEYLRSIQPTPTVTK